MTPEDKVEYKTFVTAFDAAIDIIYQFIVATNFFPK